jgi:hypothetical protein
VRFELADRHFPLFAQGKTLVDTRAVLAVRTSDALDPGALAISVDGAPVASWSAQPDLGGVRGANLPGAFTSNVRPRTHVIKVTNSGALAPANAADGALDPEKLQDLLIVLEYKLE